MEIPLIDCVINSTSLSEAEPGVRFVCKSALSAWKDVPDAQVEVSQLQGGMTNKLYRCSAEWKQGTVQRVLVRVYGNHTELIIDRKAELTNIVELHNAGVGPQVYGKFTNGYIYSYLEGRALTPEDLWSGKLNEKIAVALAKWHTQQVSGDKTLQVWNVLHNWMNTVPETYPTPEKNEKFQQKLGGKSRVQNELTYIQNALSSLPSPVIFTHNDLLAGNIIYNQHAGDISFIDYEYSCYNYRGFDIGNHFNEWAGFDADYSKYPSKQQQYDFLCAYLKASQNSNNSSYEPTESELHSLYVEANKFALLSHFYWGMWALIQAYISDIDFDFLQYAIERFDQYYKVRDTYLNL